MSERAQDGQTRDPLEQYFEGLTERLLARHPEFAAALARVKRRRERKTRRYQRRTAMAATVPLPFKHRNRGWRRR